MLNNLILKRISLTLVAILTELRFQREECYEECSLHIPKCKGDCEHDYSIHVNECMKGKSLL